MESNTKDSDKLQVTSNELKTNDSKNSSLVTRYSSLPSDPLLVTRHSSLVTVFKVTRHSSLVTDKGFTLIELLIAISILGLILVIVGGASRLGFRSVDSGERKIESLERFKVSLGFIDSQVQSMIPLTLQEEAAGDRNYLFKGERTSMQFPTRFSIWDDRGGYVTVTYTVETDGKGKQTLHASESIVGAENKRETDLFRSMDGISFEYFSKDPMEEEGAWVEQWTNREALPEKIRMLLVDGSKKLSLIIPVRAKGLLVDRMNAVISNE